MYVHLVSDVWLVERVREGEDKRTRTQVSMMDVDMFRAIAQLLCTADNARRTGESRARGQCDSFGDVHLLLFGDFKRPP